MPDPRLLGAVRRRKPRFLRDGWHCGSRASSAGAIGGAGRAATAGRSPGDAPQRHARPDEQGGRTHATGACSPHSRQTCPDSIRRAPGSPRKQMGRYPKVAARSVKPYNRLSGLSSATRDRLRIAATTEAEARAERCNAGGNRSGDLRKGAIARLGKTALVTRTWL